MAYPIDIFLRAAYPLCMGTPLKAMIFKSNRSQAVRLPKAAAFPDHVKELTVIRDGLGLRLVPTELLWDDFFNRPGIPDWPDREPEGEWPEREPL